MIYVHVFMYVGRAQQLGPQTDAKQSPGTGRDAEGEEKELRETPL